MTPIYQYEATNGQYLFCLLFYILTIIVSYSFVKDKRTHWMAWTLCFVFCLFSYFDLDYFSYERSLMVIGKDYRDPLYYYFAVLSGRNNLLYRSFIWGVALLLFYLTIKRLELNRNVTAFVFVLFFLPLFSYARASLAMAIFFYGLSLICVPLNNKKSLSDILGITIILLSYFAHRSMLVIFVAIPFAFIKLKKKHIVLLTLLFPTVLGIVSSLMERMTDELFFEGSSLEAFSEAAQSYSNQSRLTRNWKFALINNLKNIGFLVPVIVLLWKTKFSKKKITLSKEMEKMLSTTVVIVFVALAFLMITEIGATDVIGYRILYMSGIPLVIIYTYLVQNKLFSIKSTILTMSWTCIAIIGFMIGKLFIRS